MMVLVLRFWLLPNIENYREAIVAHATEAVGRPVKIAAIEAGWLGLRPQISLTDVRLYDAGGREVLALPLVENVVSWRSLVFRDLRLHSLLIDGPRVTVRRDAEGGLHVAGIKLSGGDTREPRFTDWLLGQSDIVIRNAAIEWRDEKRGAPPLALTSLSLRIRNEGEAHALGLNARPPAELGSTLDVRATLAGRTVTDVSAWSGRVYAEVGDTDLAAWRAWFDYPVDLRRGRGAVRLWATLAEGEVRGATADVALAEVDARLGRDLAPLELESVRGRVSARSDEQGYEIFARNLLLVVPHGPQFQETDFHLTWRPARAGGGNAAAESGSLRGKLIEFQPLAHLASSLPLPGEVRRLIAELEPRGQLADARVDWNGPLAAPERYRARARFADLALNPWRSMPGFSGLSGSFEATQSAGRLNLTARKAVVSLPRLFPEPDLRFDTLSGHLEWERSAERGFAVRLSAMSFANAELTGQASGAYSNDGSGPGKIDLTASLSRADGRQLARYLPHPHVMGPRTRAWLASGILDGQASDASLRLRGELAEFPFRDPASGQFLVTARVRGGLLSYASDWPSINEIDADLRFERERMEISGRSGTVFGARLAAVRVVIPDLDAPSQMLTVTGQADGPTSEFLRFIEASPVKRMTGGMTATLGAAGNGRLRIRLDIPVQDLPATRVAGEYELLGNNVAIHPQLPAVERAAGKVAFTDSGFTVNDVRGRLFGGTVLISGGSTGGKGGGGVEIVARGDATLVALGTLFEHPWKRYLSGAAPYTATVNITEGLARISVESSLRGVASALPPPLEKSAADALPLRVEVYPESGGRERISVALGRVAAAEFLRHGHTQRTSIALS
ncbi:MAG: YhdP family phospholipid transporter, partial [Betaproteobacteria bacterium]